MGVAEEGMEVQEEAALSLKYLGLTKEGKCIIGLSGWPVIVQREELKKKKKVAVIAH